MLTHFARRVPRADGLRRRLAASRSGMKKTLLLGALVLGAAHVLAGGMTTISNRRGHGQSRIQLWSDGLTFSSRRP